MTSGMPFCSATWAIAVVWLESKAPIRSCAPSLISFSARHTIAFARLIAGRSNLVTRTILDARGCSPNMPIKLARPLLGGRAGVAPSAPSFWAGLHICQNLHRQTIV